MIVPSVAHASARWSAPTQVDSAPLVSVSCPWSAPQRIDAERRSCPSAPASIDPTRLIAKLSVTVQHAGATKVKLKLTRRYRQLLDVSQRATVVAKGTFTPKGRQATSVTKRFMLRG
jgi:hypothetical protein